MTEEQAIKVRQQEREFPETMAIMARLREALAARLFKTPVNAAQERENLYLRVQTFDAMMTEMEMLLAGGAGEKAIEEYLESLKTPATTAADRQP